MIGYFWIATLAVSTVDRNAITGVVEQDGWHFLDPNDVIHEPARRRALRHSKFWRMVEFRLRQCQAAMLLDCLHAHGAIAPESGENDADSVLAFAFRQRLEKCIDRHPSFGGRGGPGEGKLCPFEPQDGIGQDDEDPIGAGWHLILGAHHLHGRAAPYEFHKRARISGIEMLDEDEGHTGVGGHAGKEGSECLQAAGRRTDAKDQICGRRHANTKRGCRVRPGRPLASASYLSSSSGTSFI